MTELRGSRDSGEARETLRLLLSVLVALVVVAGALWLSRNLRGPGDDNAVEYDPPVLAGRVLGFPCSGGFYARRADTIVLTSTGHCGGEGVSISDAQGRLIGHFAGYAREATCPHPGHSCWASDMSYVVLEPDRIPWGHLNEVNLGRGGYRVIGPDVRPLACEDIAIGDPLEVGGYLGFRTGTVAEKGENLKDGDPAFFPCMVAARVPVATGDSGGSVLVRGIPGGVMSRSFGGLLGFTPLAEGLELLGLELCVTPDCGLTPPPQAAPNPTGG
jgi:hypothetical protein